MDVKRLYSVYFSPLGNAQKVANTSAIGAVAALGGMGYVEIDITHPDQRASRHSFRKGDLVIFCLPVYAGRIPNKLLPYIQEGFEGNGALALCYCVYGNRNFDNALAELAGELTDHGFHVIGASAVPSQHSFSAHLAAGRPDRADLDAIKSFTRDKLAALHTVRSEKKLPSVQVPGQYPAPAYYTPLQRDGSPARFLKAVPKTDDSRCTDCGVCVRSCPMGVIAVTDNRTITGPCIKCHACVNKCPENAKYFDDEQLASHIAMLEENYGDRHWDILFV